GPDPDTAVTASISVSSLTHSTLPVAPSRRCASSRCAELTCALATATVMPRPMAAGVLGMARTMAAPGSAPSRNAKVFPAMIERISVAGPAIGRNGGSASPAACGLTAMTMIAASVIDSSGTLRRRPRPASAAIALAGCGSITATRRGSSPSASQLSSIAPPILPAPMRTRVLSMSSRVRAVMAASCHWPRGRSRLAGGLEHGRAERLARWLARPDHELEAGKIALAGFQRGLQQGLALRAGGRHAAAQHQGVAIHNDSVLRPKIEMADPELLVDQGNEELHFRAPPLRHLQIEHAGQVQSLDIGHPGEGNLVVRPAAARQNSDFVLAQPFESPIMPCGNAFHLLKRVAAAAFGKSEKGHAVSCWLRAI